MDLSEPRGTYERYKVTQPYNSIDRQFYDTRRVIKNSLLPSESLLLILKAKRRFKFQEELRVKFAKLREEDEDERIREASFRSK